MVKRFQLNKNWPNTLKIYSIERTLINNELVLLKEAVYNIS